VNIIPNSVRGMEVPYAVWHRETPAYAKLRAFGCAVLSYVDKVERRKLQAKAREAVFVGYSREKRGYRLLDSKTNKAFYSHTVVFYENKAGRLLTDSLSTPSAAPTSDYFDVDRSVEDEIEPMLDEMHQGANEEHNDADSRSTGGANDTSEDDRRGGADERDLRSGGANGQCPSSSCTVAEQHEEKEADHLRGECRMKKEVESENEAVGGARHRLRKKKRHKPSVKTLAVVNLQPQSGPMWRQKCRVVQRVRNVRGRRLVLHCASTRVRKALALKTLQ